MELKIVHTTDYTYENPVGYALQRLRLTPRPSPGQIVRDWSVRLEGAVLEAQYLDHFENCAQLVRAVEDTRAIRITAEGIVDTSDQSGVAGQHTGYAPLWLFKRESILTRPGKLVREIARGVSGASGLDRLHALLAAVTRAVVYEPGHTDASTPAEEALEKGRGVCQDHAHVFLAAARLMDFPARYVSGYLSLDEAGGTAQSHAWAEAHLPDLGWVGFDPANGISPDPRYVRVATGLDYRDAAPVSGIRMGTTTESLAVSVVVEQ